MKYLLLIIAFSCTTVLNAQYGTTYQFHFTLRDSLTKFNSATKPHKVKTRRRGRQLLLKTRDEQYLISSEVGYPLSVKDGMVTISYGVVPPNTHFEITITRRYRKTRSSLQIELHQLLDEDFAELNWQKDNLMLDLSYGQNLIDYELVTPKTTDGHRDLTCLLSNQCTPSWQLTRSGIAREAAYRVAVFEQRKNRFEQQIDSLISAHFHPGIFSQIFDLECSTGYYRSPHVPKPKNCEIAVDTSLVGLMHQYQLKAPQLPTPFFLMVYANEAQGAYFGNYAFGSKQFSRDEFNFLSPQEIGRFAQKTFPDAAFTKDENGLPIATLLYLGEEPKNSTPKQNFFEELGELSTEKDTSDYPGTFAYYLQQPLPQVGYLYGYEMYYFYAHKPKFILKTENYYDLLDE